MMSHSMESSGNLKIFTGLILLYFVFLIYLGFFNALFFRLGLNTQIMRYVLENFNQYLNYVADALLVISGIFLLSLSKVNQHKRSRIGAAFLLILGIYGIWMNLILYYFIPTLIIATAMSITTLSLSAVTFLLVGTSVLNRRTRPLLYGGSLLLFVFCSFSVASLFSIGFSIPISGNTGSFSIGSFFLHILDFELYAAWLPQLLYFVAFLFVSQNIKEPNTPEKVKIPDSDVVDQDKIVVVEK